MRTTRIVGALIAATLIAACGSGGGASPSPSESTGVGLRSTGSITILSPTQGQEVSGSEVTVKVRLTGATLSKVVTTHIRADTGHLHIRLDGKTITLLGSLETKVPVTPGTHLLEVEFVASDHSPFTPRVIQAVTFTVTG